MNERLWEEVPGLSLAEARRLSKALEEPDRSAPSSANATPMLDVGVHEGSVEIRLSESARTLRLTPEVAEEVAQGLLAAASATRTGENRAQRRKRGAALRRRRQ